MQNAEVTLLRLEKKRAVCARTAKGPTRLYNEIKRGTFPRPIKPTGTRTCPSVWPSHEVDAMIAADIAGMDEAALRGLVIELEAARPAFAARARRL